MCERSSHRRRAHENVPLVEELFPRDDRPIAPVQMLEVRRERSRLLLGAGLENAEEHSDQLARASHVLAEIELGQSCFFDDSTEWDELRREFLHRIAHVRRDWKSAKRWG